MTKLDIRLFDADLADRTELREYHELMVVTAPDWSDEPSSEYDAAIERLKNPAPELGPYVTWAAYLDDRMVGFEKIGFPEKENAHIAFPEIDIHPEARRRGIGTDMLRSALPTLTARGRTDVELWSVTEGLPGESWALHHGFQRVHTTALQRLSVDSVTAGLWDVGTPAGYHVVSWISSAPDDIVASYARARGAMADAPLGGSIYENPTWTVARVRAAEEECRNNKVELRVVAAVDESGEVAGFTELNIREYRTDLAFQGDTAVRSTHRGRALGRFVKARMAAWTHADHPGLTCVLTSTAATNAHMIRVNSQVGYVISRRTLVMNSTLPDLERRLGAVQGGG